MRGGSLLLCVLLAASVAIAATAGAAAPTTRPARPAGPRAPKPSPALQKILDGKALGSVAEIKEMQAHVRALCAYVTRATVGVRINGIGGSGVVVTANGYVLTCAHITRQANMQVTIMFPDGRRAEGKTLGANFGMDAGLIKITDKPTDKAGWPFCQMGMSAKLKQGQWCLAAGHPGGFRANRTPPVRLGRVLWNTAGAIVTDCTIVSGDSGGPLFDAAGKVIGIGSRIAGPLDANIHVPVDAYAKSWNRLAKGETWDGQRRGRGAYLGVQSDASATDARIFLVRRGSAAAEAGLKAADVVKRFDGKPVTTFASLVALVSKKKPGDNVTIIVQRGEKTITLKATLGKRG